MSKKYVTEGVCSASINFDIRDGRVYNVSFDRGCSGNLAGIGRLVEGMPVEEVVSRVKGIGCGNKSTSCPDQLALALERELKNQSKNKNS